LQKGDLLNLCGFVLKKFTFNDHVLIGAKSMGKGKQTIDANLSYIKNITLSRSWGLAAGVE
jgi:hypothetical protein